LVREKLLLLCRTYPDFSQKYYYRICMAGITESGELRRIFPIPIRFYLKNINFFKNYNWIVYERKGKGDHRKESYKIDFKSIRIVEPASPQEICQLINERLTSLEELSELKNQENISLGFIKPKIKKSIIDKSENRKDKKANLDSQLTLFGGRIGEYYVPYVVKFSFSCLNSPSCSGHNIMCEDINFWYFFKEKLEKKDSIEAIKKDFNDKFLNWILNDKDLVFMMGTHYLFKTWLIISIISPIAISEKRFI